MSLCVQECVSEYVYVWCRVGRVCVCVYVGWVVSSECVCVLVCVYGVGRVERVYGVWGGSCRANMCVSVCGVGRVGRVCVSVCVGWVMSGECVCVSVCGVGRVGRVETENKSS